MNRSNKKNGIGHCRRRKKAVLEMQNCNSKLMRKIIPKEKHENRFKMVLSSHGGKFEQKKNTEQKKKRIKSLLWQKRWRAGEVNKREKSHVNPTIE